ncbi:hypothetical protein M9H77_32233 [Catharanthus roseus]|uniref:Uncharacterized protein n=1 Tax=Catharanthus roseus TaxID=4058 RepID=A0ACC0A2R8_CATRO|nr:hypothetical protein M9H77_32233 [Catharanthus roseus]
MENSSSRVLHVVMFPWLAMGHLIPFLKLSKCLAKRGHLVSFISTPRNLERLPKIPSDLAPLIRLISFPFPKVENLPDQAESSMDIPYTKAQFLKIAFDLLELPLASFLENTSPKPDWIIYDYASHWLPEIATKVGISKAYFSLFTAAMMCFTGPPSILLNREEEDVEDFTIVPNWIPFETNVCFHHYEISHYVESSEGNESGTSDVIRFAMSVDGSDLVLFRTCIELEPEWFNLVCDLYKKPVIEIGVLPPQLDDDENIPVFSPIDKTNPDLTRVVFLESNIKDWLDKQSANSVVYVALGTEASLRKEQVHELAYGLEKCGLPFFWVLRKPPGSTKDVLEMLPNGFMDRVSDHGFVYTEWVPQVEILRHPSIGGFLTHCGWNSVVEALSFGKVLILFPIMNDQGLNARVLQGKKVGLEIPRNPKDGSFTSGAVAETLQFVVVSDEGEELRGNARDMRSLFGDEDRNNSYIDSFVGYLAETDI